jgi:hypothetical protein
MDRKRLLFIGLLASLVIALLGLITYHRFATRPMISSPHRNLAVLSCPTLTDPAMHVLRVDILATSDAPGLDGRWTTTMLENVALLVSPEDAKRLTLPAQRGHIRLSLCAVPPPARINECNRDPLANSRRDAGQASGAH